MSPLPRRSVLLAPLGLLSTVPLASCTQSSTVTTPNPDRAVLAAALNRESACLSVSASMSNEARQDTRSRTIGLMATQVLTAHVLLLQRSLATSTSATAASPAASAASATTFKAMARRLTAVADEHASALPGVGPGPARLLSSLAASDAALAAVLRREP